MDLGRGESAAGSSWSGLWACRSGWYSSSGYAVGAVEGEEGRVQLADKDVGGTGSTIEGVAVCTDRIVVGRRAAVEVTGLAVDRSSA